MPPSSPVAEPPPPRTRCAVAPVSVAGRRTLGPSPCVVAALTLVAGCRDDPPYTPFTAEAGPKQTAAASAAPSASVPAAAPKFAVTKSLVAPSKAKRWRLDGLDLTAPEGRTFERGLTGDLDGDGKKDAVAWTVADPAEKRRFTPSALVFYPAGAAPREVMTMPGFVPTGPGCTTTSRLARTGPKTVTLDVSAKCTGPLVARAPTRAVFVVAPAAQRPLTLGLRAAPPAAGEKLTVSVSSTDRDGDGRDDVWVDVTVSHPASKTSMTAPLKWFDRAAGPSRDASEPAATLAKLASIQQIRSKGKNTSKNVAQRVAGVRRLYATLCAESGTARLFDAQGAAVPCGGLTSMTTRLLRAEVRAALTTGDVREALAALGRADWHHAAPSQKAIDALEQEIEKKATVRDIKAPLHPTARVDKHTGVPRWSPLAFESDGSLLVQSAAGMTRVSKDGATASALRGPATNEAPGDAGSPEPAVPRWATEVVGNSGNRWRGVVYPCDRSEVTLDYEGIDPLPTRLLAPRPGSCSGGKVVAMIPAPLHLKGDTLSALIAGSLVGPPMKIAKRGSPRSPDGNLLVGATRYGLLITGGDKPELWRGPGVGPSSTLSDCTVSNGAKSVACVRAGRVVMFVPAP